MSGLIRRTVPLLLPLVLLNCVLFYRFYFCGEFYPGDFSYTYHALVAFFVSSFRKTGFPEWMPFERGGYPVLLSLQTGFFYPVQWLLALIRLPFTLETASILQSVHVLFGSIG